MIYSALFMPPFCEGGAILKNVFSLEFFSPISFQHSDIGPFHAAQLLLGRFRSTFLLQKNENNFLNGYYKASCHLFHLGLQKLANYLPKVKHT